MRVRGKKKQIFIVLFISLKDLPAHFEKHDGPYVSRRIQVRTQVSHPTLRLIFIKS